MIWLLANLRTIGYAAGGVAILGLLFVVNGWRKDSAELEGVVQQIEAERSCSDNSICARRAIESKAESERVVNALREVNEQREKQAREAQEQREKAATDKLVNDLKASQDSLLSWQRKYQAELAADQQCAVWAAQKVACSL